MHRSDNIATHLQVTAYCSNHSHLQLRLASARPGVCLQHKHLATHHYPSRDHNLDICHLLSKRQPCFCGSIIVEARVTSFTFRFRLPATWKIHKPSIPAS
ncbi:hypothetical protein CLOM_g17438 [Closterium sp. NIES-68]|nr:hypothetical protein CLOM_g17438 [Closterium sp. NIES-68]